MPDQSPPPDQPPSSGRSSGHRPTTGPQPDNCTVGIDDEQFPAYDNGVRWNGWVCPTFRREIAEEVTAYFNTINAASPWPEEQDYFVWVGHLIVHVHGAYLRDPDYTPIIVDPDTTGRYAVGAMAWTWRRTDEHNRPDTHSR
jgi:hypothetical protein